MPLMKLVALSVGSVAPLIGATTTLTFGILARNTQHQEVMSPNFSGFACATALTRFRDRAILPFNTTVQRYPPLYFIDTIIITLDGLCELRTMYDHRRSCFCAYDMHALLRALPSY